MNQIGAQELCPCGSGLKYIDCCLDRAGFKWVKDNKGNIKKAIRLSKEGADSMRKQVERALQKKEEGTNPSGLLFPDLDLDKFFNYTLSTMIHPDIHEKVVGFREEYDVLQIYSYLVEELLLTKENIVKLDTVDRVLVLNAMTKYFYEPDKKKLLEPYKDRMNSTIYKVILRIFNTEPVSKETLHKYIDLLGDESVVRVAEKQRKLNRNALCFCGSGKKYKKCCGNNKSTRSD